MQGMLMETYALRRMGVEVKWSVGHSLRRIELLIDFNVLMDSGKIYTCIYNKFIKK